MYFKEHDLRKLLKTLSSIKRSDKKLWPFLAVIPVWRDKTSFSTCRESKGSARKTASGNYCKTLSAFQRSDQKLWPSSAVIPVWRDKTSSSTSRDSIGTTMKTASRNYCKTCSRCGIATRGGGGVDATYKGTTSKRP